MASSLTELAQKDNPHSAEFFEALNGTIEANQEIDVGAVKTIEYKIGPTLKESRRLFAAIMKCIRRKDGNVTDELVAYLDEKGRNHGKGPADIVNLHERLCLPDMPQRDVDPLGVLAWADIQSAH
ncbi:MAG TPA: hypothetical protein VHA78_02350 [Candidatus Peribacteraceae bacterium]|nr:hypothetical protein [Candidatus Peribacteraceae bacterium]